MPGFTQDILPMTAFDFSDLGDAGVAEVVLARAVDVSTTTQLLLECRLHEKSIGAAGAKIELFAYPELPSAQDPSRSFLGSQVCTLTINSATGAAPLLLTEAFTADPGAAARIVLRATQAGTAVSSLAVTISLALSHKS